MSPHSARAAHVLFYDARGTLHTSQARSRHSGVERVTHQMSWSLPETHNPKTANFQTNLVFSDSLHHQLRANRRNLRINRLHHLQPNSLTRWHFKTNPNSRIKNCICRSPRRYLVPIQHKKLHKRTHLPHQRKCQRLHFGFLDVWIFTERAESRAYSTSAPATWSPALPFRRTFSSMPRTLLRFWGRLLQKRADLPWVPVRVVFAAP